MSEQTATVGPVDAKAQVKADKAYQKAMRPWFKKKRFILPLAFLLLIVVISVTSGGDEAKDAATPVTADEPAVPAAEAAPEESVPPAEEPAAAGIGTAVRDGKFEFTVTKVERPGATVGEDFLEETAQGEFVIVYVNVANVGDEGQMLDSSSQTLIDDQGREFNPSSAMFSLPDADKVFLENINPGNTVTDAPLLFDVAPGTVLDSIELHDSMFSGGVSVKLS